MTPEQLRAAAAAEIWAILPAALVRLMASVPVAAKAPRLPAVKGSVAILPMHGELVQRGSIWDMMFGATSMQRLSAQYARAVNDERIGAIVFDVDSPGGTVQGTPEAAAIIAEGSKIKPTYAVATGLCCSAAYWLSSQVGPGKLFASPSSDVGSIGVLTMHEDITEALADMGVKITMIGEPEYKTEGWPYLPLSEEAKAHYQERVQSLYGEFVAAIAAARNVKASVIKADYGKGRTMNAADAAKVGMIDGVKTLSQAVAELTRGGGSATRGDAEAIANEIWNAGEQSVCESLRKPLSTANYEARWKLLTK